MSSVQEELQRFHRDTQYYEEHYEELLRQYPEQWIAIYNEHVAGASPDYRRLLYDLKERGIPIEKAFFEYMTHEEEDLILFS